ncbi:MAG TPA: site-2 protease family protein [Candidatus Bathyarchaeota archaeon]|nr:site-2 protease family protein [Candidatus Bathyarchaeota archaeon]
MASGVLDEHERFRLVEGAIVSAGFRILEVSMYQDVLSFLVEPPADQKAAFERLVATLSPHGLLPVMRKAREGLVLRVIPFRLGRPTTSMVPFLLFLATVASIFATGWLLSSGWPEGPFLGALMFLGSMMAILATHEMGHWIVARLHGVSVSLPYFIPAPPPLTPFGTFGAFIRQRSPAPNKDALFDIGVAGPLAGFVASVAITLIGLPLCKVTVGPIPGAVRLPYIFAYALVIRLVLGPQPEGASTLLHPVAFAGWIGMVVTMLNLIPAGSLDGGHIARCVLGPDAQRNLGIAASIALLVISLLPPYGGAYMLMAILALLMAFQKHPGPLDDVSELSPARKAALILPVLIFVLCIIPLPIPF